MGNAAAERVRTRHLILAGSLQKADNRNDSQWGVMRIYNSFLVRCWLIQDPSQGERSVIEVEHIQTGASTRAASLTEAESWVFKTCHAARVNTDETQDARGSPRGQPTSGGSKNSTRE